MSPTYASSTTVSTESSRAEIERTLTRYGAQSFAYGWSGHRAMIEFAMNDRRIRFVLALPDKEATEFWLTPAGRRKLAPEAAHKKWEQACRQRWRALNLVIKAKLEAVEAEISTVESEFLSWTVLPDGTTAGEWIEPQIAEAYETGIMPMMLPQLGSGT